MNTTDGGASWTVQDSSNKQFWSIHFTDKDHGWAVGYKESGINGFIYHTTDGGQSWSIQDSSQYDLMDVFFVNADTGYVAGGGRSRSALLKTTDAGTTWEELDQYGQQLYDLQFINDTVGWAVGQQGLILKTENGGSSWDKTYVDVGLFALMSVSFVDQDTGWTVGSDSIFKTTNGGDTWQSLEGLSDHYYSSCFFINANSGWVTASGNSINKILYTPDGGNNWQVQDSITSFSTISSLFFIDDLTGWGVGIGGTIKKTTSGGLVSVRDERYAGNMSRDPFGLHQNYPNPFNSVTTISYQLPVSSHVRIDVYGLQGKKVSTLVDKKQSAGKYDLIFDGSGLAGGIYYYQLTDERGTTVKRMLLVK
jgi:photosystem II stability/assembly factor-like uncharacterized protein